MVQPITTLSALRDTVAGFRRAGETVALVPTMGALHDGHLELVRQAKKHAAQVVVSIFVNPTQFGPNEDFSRYPRPLAQDLALLESVGAAVAWVPAVDQIYPEGFATSVQVRGVSEGLCGAARPGHFDGVATVVSKLLLQVMPDVALFGEKDYQQLCVIKCVVADLNIPVQILGVPTVREADGLARSSRNQYLTESERSVAPKLHEALRHTAAQLREGMGVVSAIAEAKQRLLAAGFGPIDYLELRAEDSLAPRMEYHAPSRLLVAAYLGKTRLIDNVAL